MNLEHFRFSPTSPELGSKVKTEHCPEFERDEYLERLIVLSQRDPARFLMLPKELREIVAEYEREKEAIEKDETKSVT